MLVGKYVSELATACADRIVVERDLRRPIPVARAKTYLELPSACQGDRVTGAMAVYQALQLREELQQILVRVYRSHFKTASVQSNAARFRCA